MPPQIRPPTARNIGIEDIDRAVKKWFSHVVNPYVVTPNGDRRAVPVLFSAGERWVAASDRAGIRDKDGRVILPVIQIGRTGINTSQNLTALGSNVPRLQVSRLISEKTPALAELDRSRPLSSRRLRQAAVYEVYTIPFPITMALPYSVTVQAQYQWQMNQIIQKILSKLEFYDVPSFVIDIDGLNRPAGVSTGEGTTELTSDEIAPYEIRSALTDYYVVGYLEGDITNEGNMDEFTDQERIIQLRYNFHVPTALMVDPEGEKPAVQKETTAFNISLDAEEVHAVDSPADLDKIFGPK